MVAISNVKAFAERAPRTSVTIVMGHFLALCLKCKFLEDGAFSARISLNKSAKNYIESIPSVEFFGHARTRHSCDRARIIFKYVRVVPGTQGHE